MKRIYPKTKIIYQIRNFGNKVYFIEKNNNGETYTNQTGGTACFHPTYKGNLHQLISFKNPPLMFNPDWWYGLMYRDWGVLESKYRESFPEMDGSVDYIKEMEKQEDKCSNSPHIIKYDRLAKMFEASLKKILPEKFFDCQVIHPFHNDDKYGIPIGETSQEAWVFVRLYYRTKNNKLFRDMGMGEYSIKYKEGVITWANCD